ncbi:hypothetical protein [Cryptosporangium sp. NPDC051539]|uniref:hypothetical protein n=1 Tax=Cryptosporangium sp. NPDC051539 TaxID=3363962 RepID=UPI0037A44F9F
MMRTFLRTLVIVAAVLAVARPADARELTPNNGNPSFAVLTAADITFTTREPTSERATLLVEVLTSRNEVAAYLSGDFDEGPGPYALPVRAGVPATDLLTGHLGLIVTPIPRDSWRFGYEVTLHYSDGTSTTFGAKDQDLTAAGDSLLSSFT